MDTRIKKIFLDVFGCSIEEINDESSPNTIKSWDSLNQMNLIVALEQEFNVQFSDDDIDSLQSFALIKVILAEAESNF